MNENALLNIQKWLNGSYDPDAKEEIRRLLKEKPDALNDAFYRDLAFGTGGMRGIMGLGTNRINIYTIRMATQGLANYLLAQNGQYTRVFIGYDVRHRSRLFAEETARVLAGNGIEALVTEEICPTPLASFGCRHFDCQAAVMITASHNPSEYNGYKVYGDDGAQIVSPADEAIIAEVRSIESPEQVKLASLDHPLVRWIKREIDVEYLKYLKTLQTSALPKSLRIVYTNLHGTGSRLIPQALENWGFASPSRIEAQASLDGSFPSAPSPNPEEERALSLGSKQLLEEKADILLATDPDADRVGLAIRNGDQAVRFNGNEIACVCLAYLIKKRAPLKKAAILKTIVTTELMRKIAENVQIPCFDVLTGFKYIAEKIRKWETSSDGYQFLFGAEESHGYLSGTFVRDKDAINTACLIGEAAEEEKIKERTLVDALFDLYRNFGVHRQSLVNLTFTDSPAGMAAMQEGLGKLRLSPLSTIDGKKIIRSDDYLQEIQGLPRSDVLAYVLEDQTRLIIRASGTEPKLKIYLEASDPPGRDLPTSIAECDARLKTTLESFREENGL